MCCTDDDGVFHRRFLLAAQVPQGPLQRPLFRPAQNYVVAFVQGTSGKVQRMLVRTLSVAMT